MEEKRKKGPSRPQKKQEEKNAGVKHAPAERKKFDRNADKNWYQKLLLSQKFKLNAILGLVLVAIGAVVLAISGPEMTHHWEHQLHGGLGLVALLAGLWLFSRGLRYESQLDAIRIAKRNRNFGGGYKKGPRPNKK